MKYIKDEIFTPKLFIREGTIREEVMRNIQRRVWLEEVGCVVLNCIKRDEYMRTESIAGILDASGRRGLVPYLSNPERYDRQEYLLEARELIGRRMEMLFRKSNVLSVGNITVARVVEKIHRLRKAPVISRWYHFLPDQDNFDYSNMKFVNPNRTAA